MKQEHEKRIKLLERTENKNKEDETVDDWDEEASTQEKDSNNVIESISIENINPEINNQNQVESKEKIELVKETITRGI